MYRSLHALPRDVGDGKCNGVVIELIHVDDIAATQHVCHAIADRVRDTGNVVIALRKEMRREHCGRRRLDAPVFLDKLRRRRTGWIIRRGRIGRNDLRLQLRAGFS